jgi:two-component system, chemotaxis family, sensor histidine kinase and response regulator PixL
MPSYLILIGEYIQGNYTEMLEDRELEIRRQFLDEAQDYLNALDEAVIGLAGGRVEIQRVNAALRAAHSIKGGAGMMSYQTLSELAHRLEDFFKVLKTQSQSLDIDPSLENLLLSGVNCLRQVIQQHQQEQEPEPSWLDGEVEPVFQELRDRLGEAPDESAASVLATDSGQDILPMIFESEVETCLQRLETAINQENPTSLHEELTILAQELGGLAEMLDLSAFSQLCESVGQAALSAPEQIHEIAGLARDAWRKTQSLVLAGHLEFIPTAISGEFSQTQPSSYLAESDQTDLSTEQAWDDSAWDDSAWDDSAWDDGAIAHSKEPSSTWDKFDDIAIPPLETAEALLTADQPLQLQYGTPDSQTTGILDEDENATVRVSVRQLNQLNDLFGELTIQRNGLDLYQKRVRQLSQVLVQRARLLEQFNSELRLVCDRITLHALESPRKHASAPNSAIAEINGKDTTFSTFSNLISIAGEGYRFDTLEMDRYNDLHLLTQQATETIVQLQEISSDIDLNLYDNEQSTREINKISRNLQSNLTQIRMRPLSDVVDRFPRAIRELCLQHHKKASLAIEGSSTLIERSLLESLNDPLMHLIRNAFDHGIESPETRVANGKPEVGTISISAAHQGNRTVITIRDDGSGISLDKVRRKAEQMGLDPTLLAMASKQDLLSLIFEPGFSTSDQVTTLSGRGVGMDVVRDRLRQIRGEISVDTQPGVGTAFTLSIPFTLSVVQVQLVECSGMLLAFPTDVIQDSALLAELDIAGDRTISWKNAAVDLVSLGEWFQFYCPYHSHSLETLPNTDEPTTLIVKQGGRTVAVQVDRSWGEQEVAIRRVEGNLPMPSGFTGCAIVADGRVVPLVNIADLLDWVAARQQEPTTPALDLELWPQPLLQTSLGNEAVDQPNTVLIVDDSINIRRFLALTLERAGFRVEQAKDGQDAIDKLQQGLVIQAVICDIEMPRLDGYGFLAKLKANPDYAHVPVAMLTSRSGDKHRQLALNLGASAYFSKPYNEQDLVRTLNELVTSN